jgi:UDPglucose--hexose-1-phosphate uridylyltransferase
MTWEERWHPLRQEWVIVAAHRQNRPWSGSTVGAAAPGLPRYVPDCYLCPGNLRVSGKQNADYAGVFVFDNDHPSVGPDAPLEVTAPHALYRVRSARGLSRVVCYSPRHDLTLAELECAEIEALLREIAHVLVFENKGEVVGVSNPHPHCQIYATNFVFRTIEVEAEASRAHHAETGRVLFADVIEAEQRDGRRVLSETATAIAFVPFFARYAYETFVAPKRTVQSLADLTAEELRDLAAVLKDVLTRFDNLWRMPFPYVMVLHQAPTDGGDYAAFHFHIEFHPPLRKPNLVKFLAGPEVGGGCFLSDTSPEEKAEELRAAAGPHYRAGR